MLSRLISNSYASTDPIVSFVILLHSWRRISFSPPLILVASEVPPHHFRTKLLLPRNLHQNTLHRSYTVILTAIRRPICIRDLTITMASVDFDAHVYVGRLSN
jgi:hypothetical protein